MADETLLRDLQGAPREADAALTRKADGVGASDPDLRRSFVDHVTFTRSRALETATPRDRFVALSLAIRDRLSTRWTTTQERYRRTDPKRAYYVSAEFLLGRALVSNLLAVGLLAPYRAVLEDLGIPWASVIEEEPEAALGNGGLGRLAACLLDALATLDMPVYGYGIRYQFGLFRQVIDNGFQVEQADDWLRFVSPWQIERPERILLVHFYGRAEGYVDERGALRRRWVDTRPVVGLPFDTPVAGYGTTTVNSLRLWSARAVRELDFGPFNRGDYVQAVAENDASELLSKVLYPSDESCSGKELRLKQEYFLSACTVGDVVRYYLESHRGFDAFPSKVAFQLNDTHPTLIIAELMRVLVDDHGVPWEKAWDITVASSAYTNHTLMREALERWPVPLFRSVLPRHLEIVFEINRRFLDQVRVRWPSDDERARRMSLIEEDGAKAVRMAALATVGSHSINGVAPIHSRLVATTLLGDYAEMTPERFGNVTNGVTPRRWILAANPGLASLVTEAIGPTWITNLDQLERLRPLAEDANFRAAFRRTKRANKEALAAWVQENVGVILDPDALFDVQAKRFHEYKRQLLNALHAIVLLRRAQEKPLAVPRVILFSGKAAPSYWTAKLIIKLVTSIARRTEQQTASRGLKVAFLPDYGVSLAERLIPAADLSQQISTAGTEASGTSNMKLAMNGALTLGTLDGANIDIREAVGAEHFFAFGHTAEELAALRPGRPASSTHVGASTELREAIDLVASGFFSPDDPGLFRPLIDGLLHVDPWFVLADFDSYAAAQRRVESAYANAASWDRSAITNVSAMGRFSADRTGREYATRIWQLKAAGDQDQLGG
jgi:glycogen phosphorylase